jgi:peptide deformylase
MGLTIAQLGQPVLRRVAEPITPEEVRSAGLQRLIEDMTATLREAGGVGLAAPQVFVSRRLFLAAVLAPREPDDPPEVEVFINPRLVPLGDEQESDWEGCLSFPELQVLVPRHRRVRVEFTNRWGEEMALECEDFSARVVQHEQDHLDGILTLDRAASTRDVIKASELDAVLEGEEEP